MLVSFTKMHSLGNDFVIIESITQPLKLHTAHIRRIADRQFGIGCDQVLIIEPPEDPDTDFYYKIYNADGQEVEQCVNGARCAARFVIDSGLINKSKLTARCIAGQVILYLEENDLVRMNIEIEDPQVTSYKINLADYLQEIHSISLGNPHGICIVHDLSRVPLIEWGEKLSILEHFPNKANITFMQVINTKQVLLQTFERGAGLTLACGSGACAAVIVGQKLGLLKNPVIAEFKHNSLTITFDSCIHSNVKILEVSGPVTSVFVGRFKI